MKSIKRENWVELRPIAMNDQLKSENTLNDIENNSDILSSFSSASSIGECKETITNFRTPILNFERKEKKYNLFHQSSYIQLIELILRSKIHPNTKHKFKTLHAQKLRNRGCIYYWLKPKVDTQNVECKQFLKKYEKTLLNLKSKRQLIYFLNKRIGKRFKNETITYGYGKKNVDADFLYLKLLFWLFWFFRIILVAFSVLAFLFIIAAVIFFKTDMVEYHIIKNPKDILLIRTFKSLFLQVIGRGL